MSTRESGKDGTVKIGATAVALVTGWDVDFETNVYESANNETAGYKAATAGVKRVSGRIKGEWNSAAALTITSGTAATLLLYLNASEFFTIPAVVKKLHVEVDVNDGNVTLYDAEFVGNGAWTEPTLT